MSEEEQAKKTPPRPISKQGVKRNRVTIEGGLVFRINLFRKCGLVFRVSRFRKCGSPTCVLCCVLVQVDIMQSMEKDSMKLYESLVAKNDGNSGESDRLEKLLEDFGNMGD